MNKQEKVKAVEELKGQLDDYKSIYLTDIAGLNAVQTSKLRRECFNSNVKLSVVKNTFLERAMNESENDFGELKDLLNGNKEICIDDPQCTTYMAQIGNLRASSTNCNEPIGILNEHQYQKLLKHFCRRSCGLCGSGIIDEEEGVSDEVIKAEVIEVTHEIAEKEIEDEIEREEEEEEEEEEELELENEMKNIEEQEKEFANNDEARI